MRRGDAFAATARRLVPPSIAITLLLLTGAKAYVDFDMAWDSIAYHLPFAALKVGIVNDSQFQLTGIVKYYYQGFPVVASYLKGWLWLLFGRPEAANFVSIASFACLVAYCWKTLKVPFAWAVIGLAAIPVVQVSLARNQIDLPANAFMTIVAFSVCDRYLRPADFGKLKLTIAILAAGFAAHFKPQMVVHVSVAALVVAILLVRGLRARSLPTAPIRSRPFSSALVVVGSIAFVFSEVFYNWLKNRNPFYPLALKVGSVSVFPGPLPPWGLWPEPVYSAHYFQPFRWALSVLEYRAFDFRRIPYTLGNGEVPNGAMSMRVGGYMGLAVMLSLVLFIALVWNRRDRTGRTYAVALSVITLVSAVQPGSHEIRYAVYWMMFLVLANMILLADGGPALSGYFRLYKLFLLCELLYVCLITGGEHVLPQFRGIAYYERQFHVDERLDAAVRGGETICLRTNPQLAFLYAPPFHQALAEARPYFVRAEGFSPDQKDFASLGSTVCSWLPP